MYDMQLLLHTGQPKEMFRKRANFQVPTLLSSKPITDSDSDSGYDTVPVSATRTANIYIHNPDLKEPNN